MRSRLEEIVALSSACRHTLRPARVAWFFLPPAVPTDNRRLQSSAQYLLHKRESSFKRDHSPSRPSRDLDGSACQPAARGDTKVGTRCAWPKRVTQSTRTSARFSPLRLVGHERAFDLLSTFSRYLSASPPPCTPSSAEPQQTVHRTRRTQTPPLNEQPHGWESVSGYAS